MADINLPRRYYLHKRLQARLYEDSDLELTWKAKQEAEPGTALPDDFPQLADLVELGYSTVEDINGADTDELALVGISSDTATAIIAAIPPLL